jgi:hypothetical protein
MDTETKEVRQHMLERLYALPREVHSMVHFGAGSWIVGSVADPTKTFYPHGPPRDYDIVVPFSDWTAFSLQLPHLGKLIKLTRFGGITLEIEGGENVDVWPDDIGRFFLNPPTRYAWHPKTMTLLKKEL